MLRNERSGEGGSAWRYSTLFGLGGRGSALRSKTRNARNENNFIFLLFISYLCCLLFIVPLKLVFKFYDIPLIRFDVYLLQIVLI